MNIRADFYESVMQAAVSNPKLHTYTKMTKGDFYRRMFYVARGDMDTGKPYRLSNEGLRVANDIRSGDTYDVGLVTSTKILFLNRNTEDLWHLEAGKMTIFGNEEWLLYLIFSGSLEETIKNLK